MGIKGSPLHRTRKLPRALWLMLIWCAECPEREWTTPKVGEPALSPEGLYGVVLSASASQPVFQNWFVARSRIHQGRITWVRHSRRDQPTMRMICQQLLPRLACSGVFLTYGNYSILGIGHYSVRLCAVSKLVLGKQQHCINACGQLELTSISSSCAREKIISRISIAREAHQAREDCRPPLLRKMLANILCQRKLSKVA